MGWVPIRRYHPLPFGLQSAPKIYTGVADVAEWIARQYGVRFIIHYLDDYLIIGSSRSEECAESLAILLSIFGCLGFPIALEKLEGPVPCLKFLGLELDSESMVICLTASKTPRTARTNKGRWKCIKHSGHCSQRINRTGRRRTGVSCSRFVFHRFSVIYPTSLPLRKSPVPEVLLPVQSHPFPSYRKFVVVFCGVSLSG